MECMLQTVERCNCISLIVFIFFKVVLKRYVEWTVRGQSLQRSTHGLHCELLCMKCV